MEILVESAEFINSVLCQSVQQSIDTGVITMMVSLCQELQVILYSQFKGTAASLLSGLKKQTGSEFHHVLYGVVSLNLLKQKEIYAKKHPNTILYSLQFQYSFEQLACRLWRDS